MRELPSGELQKRGVGGKEIILQEDSYSTFTELIELIKIIVVHHWRHVAVISNEFQIPRAQAMLERISDLHDPKGYSAQPEVQRALAEFARIQVSESIRVTFVSAEEVLPVIDSRYKKIIDEAKQLPAWEETRQRDAEGARQVRAGEYWKDNR